jgi:hypothetical protein
MNSPGQATKASINRTRVRLASLGALDLAKAHSMAPLQHFDAAPDVLCLACKRNLFELKIYARRVLRPEVRLAALLALRD